MCRLPHLLWSPGGRKRRRREGARKEGICFPRSRALQPERELYVPHVDTCMWPLSVIQPIIFSLRSTQACHRRCTFLLFCSHLADSLWFSEGEINVALTLYSKQLSPCKENVPLCRRPVILHRVRMCKLVLRKYDKSAYLSSSSTHGTWFNLKKILCRRPFTVCGHIQLHLFCFILFCFI